ncbi:uncharacterized protein KLLA0_E24817g [Kluyveromyces lactis]|uniref:KLLA0E24817p n=1 Tax=Kluyveromyces lactis (strain ATCC 8585 / CBS 2359 / DSM 70799 / NBRC 1267 / NRRL Y-1140 / WM37) TaxID=284590 RepID=B4UN88_KLULA|nr:uncharacterized protein KLLA0_E24817g [Kluyveromyces lactis]CAR56759.1 KLLA0E24817p [Kluyveromyces lactis]|eukprot:XP_002999421.1 uncharacterized protein KLLA0_E24817g [Kluyveromyces lactis]
MRFFPVLVYLFSSLPFLRKFGMSRAHDLAGGDSSMLQDMSSLSMLKIWLGLEIRQLMSISSKQIYELVKTDQLCPNY